MKVLIVKMSSMGDVIHTLPALTDAPKDRPDLVIDWCVETALAPFVRLHPGVRRINEIRLRSWRKAPFSAASWRGARALVARISRAKIAGLDGASARGPLAARFYSERHAIPRDRHAIDRLRLLFGAVLGCQPDLAAIDYGIAAPDAGSAKVVVLLHGTSWPSKRWSSENWIELARAILAEGLTPQIPHADDAEEAVARAVVAGAPGAELVPRAPLGEIARLIGRAEAVVGGDTGLTHLAAALSRPTVALFLSTEPGLTSVAGQRATVLEASIACAPCRKRICIHVPPGEVQPCVRTICPQSAFERVAKLIKIGNLRVPA